MIADLAHQEQNVVVPVNGWVLVVFVLAALVVLAANSWARSGSRRRRYRAERQLVRRHRF